MKVLCKHVLIEGQEFVLIEDKHDEKTMYWGTISYNDLDDKGRIRRMLDGFDMAISLKNPGEAIQRRQVLIVSARLKAEFIAKGYTEERASIKATLIAYGEKELADKI